MIELMWYSANLPGSPLRNTCGETISSMPFFRKTRPSESWMPRTTGWVNSLASLSTMPVSANKSDRRAEDDAGGADHGLGDQRRVGDGDRAHGLQRLHRHRQSEVIPRGEVKQPERQEDRRGAQLVDQNHSDDNGQQRAQVPEGAGKLDPVESQGAVVGLRRVWGGRFWWGWVVHRTPRRF